MSNVPEQIVSTLVSAADALAATLPGTPVGEGARVTGIVLHGAEGVLHGLFGNDVEAARQRSQALHQAAGASADLNSRLPGLRNALDSILLPLVPVNHDSVAINEAASNVRKSYIDAIVREIVSRI